ncbi:MAG: hypothetical protein AUJ96_10175 [Armatimonadetes bacterium CG2_30_66_41]|nr:VWA domain-containing protein [Armatimonadota bacterium]OIP05755.1 MAG: hypothetical protein AUJ96_10175 [Armatimonadetes bacterium CG2_30_66_41]PIW13629.1 MAG: hypothetical protein COW34_08510 [Armatimonadetes bacterium CG17_big_fil_post_rev_8_21_14_2_50_66_6]
MGGYLRFANPSALHLLFLVPVLCVLLWLAFRQKRRVIEQLGNLELIRKMSVATSPRRQVAKAVLVVLATTLALLALARPQIGTKLMTVKRRGVDIVIAIDVSSSMLAEDLKPNRLEKAKREVAGLIDRLQGDRVGLVAFAGTAFVQCPLTLDYGAAKMFLDYLDTDLIPLPGTAIGKALKVATAAFDKRERKHKVIVLVTDGEDHDSKPEDAAKAAQQQGVRIYTIGMGSKLGEPIPVSNEQGQTEYKRDEKGEVVLSKLDPVTLQKIAFTTNGKYHHASQGELELQRIYEDLSKLERKQLQTRKFTQHEDRFQLLLALAIVLLVVEWAMTDRRRVWR